MFDNTLIAFIVFGVLFAIAVYGLTVSNRKSEQNNASTEGHGRVTEGPGAAGQPRR